MLRHCLVALLALWLGSAWPQARFPLAGFADASWQAKSFAGETEYQLNADGTLSAAAAGTASGLFNKQSIDLTKTPFLNWRWRVSKLPAVTDERQKSGDDFAARVYLVVDGGLLKWRTKALNYVWSAKQPVGAHWGNPFAPKNVKMLAVAGTETPLHRWHSQKRNVRDDFAALFGADVKQIDVIAVMTDADNSQSAAKASFAQLFFSAD